GLDLALGAADGRAANRDGRPGAHRDGGLGRPAGGPALAAAGRGGAPARAPPASPARLALHPPLRGKLERRRRAVLGRAPDEPLLPGAIRRLALPDEGDGRPLDPARADLDGGEGAQEQGFLAVAEHGEVLRPYLTSL